MPPSTCQFPHVLLASRRRSPWRATRLSQRCYAALILIDLIYMQITAASFLPQQLSHVDAVREEILLLATSLRGGSLLEERLALNPVFFEDPLKTTPLFTRSFGSMRHITFGGVHQDNQVGLFELVNVLFFGITE